MPSVVGVEYGPGQRAPRPGRVFQGVFDETGAHVVGDRPAGVSPDTDTVGDEWKNHTFTFQVPAGKKKHRVSVVHAYDIDTRNIDLTKATVGTVPEGETFTFEYSLDGGATWLPQDPEGPLTVAPGDDPVTIEDVPVLDLTQLNASPSVVAPTGIMIREVLGSNADAQYVTWKVDGPSGLATYFTASETNQL